MKLSQVPTIVQGASKRDSDFLRGASFLNSQDTRTGVKLFPGLGLRFMGNQVKELGRERQRAATSQRVPKAKKGTIDRYLRHILSSVSPFTLGWRHLGALAAV